MSAEYSHTSEEAAKDAYLRTRGREMVRQLDAIPGRSVGFIVGHQFLKQGKVVEEKLRKRVKELEVEVVADHRSKGEDVLAVFSAIRRAETPGKEHTILIGLDGVLPESKEGEQLGFQVAEKILAAAKENNWEEPKFVAIAGFPIIDMILKNRFPDNFVGAINPITFSPASN